MIHHRSSYLKATHIQLYSWWRDFISIPAGITRKTLWFPINDDHLSCAFKACWSTSCLARSSMHSNLHRLHRVGHWGARDYAWSIAPPSISLSPLGIIPCRLVESRDSNFKGRLQANEGDDQSRVDGLYTSKMSAIWIEYLESKIYRELGKHIHDDVDPVVPTDKRDDRNKLFFIQFPSDLQNTERTDVPRWWNKKRRTR